MNEVLMQGVELMLAGMGIVFLFLAMLILAVKLMAYCVAAFLPEVEAIPSDSPLNQATSSNVVSPSVAAAISAAVHRYREKHK